MQQELEFSVIDGKIQFPCIEVTQPIGTFYIASIPCKMLCEITYSDVRRIEGERKFESYLGIQRKLDPKRVQKIRDYVNTIDASFPSGIIIAVDGRCANYDPKNHTMTLDAYRGDDDNIEIKQIAKVLDGQHRIEGLRGFEGEFQLNVSIFVDVDIAQQAYLFSTVNLAQTKVNKSLVYDLFDLSNTRSPQKLCHTIAVAMNQIPECPLFERISRLGSATPGIYTETITQATFVSALMQYISKDENKDRDLYMRGKKPEKADLKELQQLIFRNMMIDERDDDIAMIIFNYFSAVRNRWDKAWNDFGQGNILNRTNGFRALMRLLRPIYLHLVAPGEIPTIEQFDSIFNKISVNDFSSDTYKPGSSGESLLYNTFISEASLQNDGANSLL
ncbi:MAG: DGQHR domain-containing protein [Lentisphaeria bacterium]|nr:DGQHR domain-containing protein [Lentisphaeria bacterium]